MKKIIPVIYGIILMFCLAGCGVFENVDDMELTQEEIQEANHSKEPAVVSKGSVEKVEVLSLYTIDPIEEQLMPLKVPIKTDRITPELILDEVLANIDEKVVVTEFEIEDECIYITFSKDYAPVKKCSKKFETLILDCISNSLLDNISYIEEVAFRSEDGSYRSDNFSFGEDEVYSAK